MANIFKLLLITLTSISILTHSFVQGATLKCEFKIEEWDIVDKIYTCVVLDNGIFNGSRVTIDSIEGQHMSGKSNDDVQAIDIESISNVSYFPANIEKHFKNLTAIQIWSSQLQEINADDLQPFPNLIELRLGDNNIKKIEKDTFKYNPQLKGIYLYYNEISYIDYNVFDGLNHLETLTLNWNECKKSICNAYTRSNVLRRIKQIQNGDCIDFNLLIRRFTEKFTSKINEMKAQNEKLENQINEKLQMQDKKFNDNVAKFFALQQNQEELKNERNDKKVGMLQTLIKIISKKI